MCHTVSTRAGDEPPPKRSAIIMACPCSCGVGPKPERKRSELIEELEHCRMTSQGEMGLVSRVRGRFLASAANRRGMQLYGKGDYAGAIAEYDRAISLSPSLAEAYNNRGNAYDSLGEPRRALDDYNMAINLNPAMALAYYNRAVTLQALGQLAGAIADYSRAVELRPNAGLAFMSLRNRAKAYREKGDPERAQADEDHARKLDPDKAIQEYGTLLAAQPEEARLYQNRGASYGMKGDFKHAVTDLTRAIELQPDYAEAYDNRGVAYAEMGQPDMAVLDFDKAIELRPDYAEAYSNRGTAYGDMHDYERAIADLSKAMSWIPTTPRRIPIAASPTRPGESGPWRSPTSPKPITSLQAPLSRNP